MKNTQEQIKEIFNTHFPKYADHLDFIDKLGCADPNGMCWKFNKNRRTIYQFLPLPLPKSPAEFIFICKEPSTPWARGTSDAYDKVIKKQYMNFISGERKNNKLDIMITAFRNVFMDKSIFITDMSKCAIDTNVADDFGFKDNLSHRYICCSPYLQWELKKLAVDNPAIFLVGRNYFFAEWFRRKYPEMKNDGLNDITCFNKFLVDVVRLKVDDQKITMLPHYSIRFSCPEYILRMLKSDKVGIQKEIKDGLSDLYQYYLDNFILTKNTTERIIRSINESIDAESNKELSDSIILLYLLYKNEFELVKKSMES